MRCPGLSELPPPREGKKGWPWTEDSEVLAPSMPDGSAWPRITLVTPSFNQAAFLEETIRSILLQGYPDLEYLVMDGGSTDGSVEIIKKYSPWIAAWVSEPDGGQSAAINRGLKMGSGLFAGWINSDDMLHQNALFTQATRIGLDARDVYLGTCAYMDADGNVQSIHRSRIHRLEDLLRVPQVWRRGGNIVQPEVLFPRALALEVGGLDADNHYSMDYELWGKFLIAGARFRHTEVPFGMLRRHADQKTADGPRTTQSLMKSALKLLDLPNGLSLETKADISADLQAYFTEYPDRYWRNTGRLARIGLPHSIVAGIRRLARLIRGPKTVS
jgi:glycosyltransferase involved in cell wall biosynthesis